jgi:hypothetical protein
LNQQSQVFKDSFGYTYKMTTSVTVEDVVYGLCQPILLMQHLNYGAAEAVVTEPVVASFQIDQRLEVLTVLELFKQLQVANTQSVQAVQQYVAVSDVLEETDILVL